MLEPKRADKPTRTWMQGTTTADRVPSTRSSRGRWDWNLIGLEKHNSWPERVSRCIHGNRFVGEVTTGDEVDSGAVPPADRNDEADRDPRNL